MAFNYWQAALLAQQQGRLVRLTTDERRLLLLLVKQFGKSCSGLAEVKRLRDKLADY